MQERLLDIAFDPERNYMNNVSISWVYVYGYEGDYAVSSIGDVFSFKTEKTLKARKSGNTKYLKVDIYKEGKRKTVNIHQIVWESFHQMKIPSGYHVDHINGNREENQLTNLQLLSMADHILKHTKIKVSVLTLKYPYRKDFTNALQLKHFGFTMKQVNDFVNFNHGYDTFHQYYFTIGA